MATDATGTPTTLGIPTYNVNVDAPSGNGFNAAMAEIDSLLRGTIVGTESSTVSTTGTTFAAGQDVLASALSFTAISGVKYRVRISAPSQFATTTSGGDLHLNLDGADDGIIASYRISAQTPVVAETIISPSAGAHTVNIRLVAGSGTTFSVQASTGGAGNDLATYVIIEAIA